MKVSPHLASARLLPEGQKRLLCDLAEHAPSTISDIARRLHKKQPQIYLQFKKLKTAGLIDYFTPPVQPGINRNRISNSRTVWLTKDGCHESLILGSDAFCLLKTAREIRFGDEGLQIMLQMAAVGGVDWVRKNLTPSVARQLLYESHPSVRIPWPQGEWKFGRFWEVMLEHKDFTMRWAYGLEEEIRSMKLYQNFILAGTDRKDEFRKSLLEAARLAGESEKGQAEVEGATSP